jgi:hypothetical protein
MALKIEVASAAGVGRIQLHIVGVLSFYILSLKFTWIAPFMIARLGSHNDLT